MLESKINDEEYTLINVYAPNKDEQLVKFFHSLSIVYKTDWLGSLTSFKRSVQSCFVLC